MNKKNSEKELKTTSKNSFFASILNKTNNLKYISKEKKLNKEKNQTLKELEKIKKELDNIVKIEKESNVKLIEEQKSLNKKEIEVKKKLYILEVKEKNLKQKEEEIKKEHNLKIEEQKRKEKIEKERIEKLKEEEKRKKQLEIQLKREKIEKEREEKRKEKEQKEKLHKEKIEKELAEKQKLEQEKLEIKKQIRLVAEKKKEEERTTRKLKLEATTKEEQLIISQNEILKKENEINSAKLKLTELNKKYADENNKNKIIEQEKYIKSLISQHQQLKKKLSLEKKRIEKQKKSLLREEKIDEFLTEINSIKGEVIGEDEPLFKTKNNDDKLENIFLIALKNIKFIILKNIFKKNITNYSSFKFVTKKIKVKIASSFILAIIFSLILLISLKFISSAKEKYSNFSEIKPIINTEINDEMKKQKEQEELEEQKKVQQLRINDEALEEEVTARLSGSFNSYSFNVNREITVTKKVHIFNTASWSDINSTIETDTKLEVNKLVSPAGYMMYYITNGEFAGKYITANSNFVKIIKQTDTLNTNLIPNPVAVKLLVNQNSYLDENLSKVKAGLYSGLKLNIYGLGISPSNRLIYHITDGSYIPVNPVKLIETERDKPKEIKNNNDNNDNSDDNENKEEKEEKEEKDNKDNKSNKVVSSTKNSSSNSNSNKRN